MGSLASRAAYRRVTRLLILLPVISGALIGGGAYFGFVLAEYTSPTYGRVLALVFASAGLVAATWLIYRITRRTARRPLPR